MMMRLPQDKWLLLPQDDPLDATGRTFARRIECGSIVLGAAAVTANRVKGGGRG